MFIRLMGAPLVALFSVFGYCNMREENPVTGERQVVAMSPEQEIRLGMQAAPRLARQYGGIEPDPQAQEIGHVLAPYGAEHLVKARLMEGLAGAAVIATTIRPIPGHARMQPWRLHWGSW